MALEQRIEAGEFDDAPINDALVETLQRVICADLTPQLAGWRRIDVAVGAHAPPEFFRVPMLVREYARDLAVRLDALSGHPDENLLETLAFAEGRLLAIHPFADFNGRTTRAFLRLLSRRIDLPWVELQPAEEERDSYIAALGAADRNDWHPLMAVWRGRFEKEGNA